MAGLAAQPGTDGYRLRSGKGERTGESFSAKQRHETLGLAALEQKFAKALVSCTIKRIPSAAPR